MKRVYKLFLVMAGLMAGLCSCVRESLDNAAVTGREDVITVDFLFDGVRSIDVKSILSDGIDTKISNIYLAVYCKGVLVTVQEAAYLDKIELKGVQYGEKYNLYAMANVDVRHNAIEDIFPYMEAGLPESGYSLSGSYMEIDSLGLPMVASKQDVEFEKGGEPVVMNLVRLFAKLTLTFNFDGLWKDCNDRGIYEEFDQCFRITKAKIRQAASVLYPFAEPDGRKAASADEISDDADHNDIDLYMTSEGSPGQRKSYVFYVPENCQGKLLPDNKDNMAKTMENIAGVDGKDYSSLCTYLDVKCTLDGSVIDESVLPYAGDITYRYYLGADNCSDFSIERNTAYNMSVDYSLDGMTLMGNWKVEHENWSDCRSIRFGKAVYEVQQGKCVDVFLNFTDVAGALNSNPFSYSPGALWKYSFPEELEADGLTYSFAPNLLKKNPDSGADDFYFVFWADENAEVGSEYELAAWCTGYGTDTGSDRYVTTKIRVVEAVPELSDYNWENNFIPRYVSQYGRVDLGKNIVSAVSSDKEICNVYANGSELYVELYSPGTVSMTVTFDDKTTMVTDFEVLAPTLVIETPSLTLNPDGSAKALYYYYADENGAELKNVEETIFGIYLALKIDDMAYIDNDYFNYYENGTADDFYVCRLYDDNGMRISIGKNVYTLHATAENCPGVNTVDISVDIVNPFEGVDEDRILGELNDYSLFQSASVCPYEDVRKHFAPYFESTNKISGTRLNAQSYSVSYNILCASGPNGKNDVWKFNCQNGYMVAEYKDVSPASVHPRGLYCIQGIVENEHSGECISDVIGKLNIYLHTALGASCDIRSDINTICNVCNLEIFDFFMQYIAHTYYSGNWINYPELPDGYTHTDCGESSIEWIFAGYINYIDVYLAFLHSAFDGEKEFYSNQESYSLMMARNEHTMKGIYPDNGNIPVKYDMPFVISGSNPLSVQRMAYRNIEHYGIVYRKVLYNNTNRLRHHDKLAAEDIFNKCNEYRYDTSVGEATGYLPEFEYVDIMGQYSDGVLDRTKPYYWSPSSQTARDVYGRGYYVIHFYDEINPAQCKADNGWCKESFRQIVNDDVNEYYKPQSLVR